MGKYEDKLEYKNPYGEIQAPEKIPKNPNLTEEQRFKMPALRFYLMMLGFCLGMMGFSALRIVLHLTISVHWTFLVEIITAAIGWWISKNIVEPRMYIDYADATAEEKLDEMNRLQRKQDEEEAEMKRLLGDKYLSKLHEYEEKEAQEKAAAKPKNARAKKTASASVDRAVFDDDEPLDDDIMDADDTDEI